MPVSLSIFLRNTMFCPPFQAFWAKCKLLEKVPTVIRIGEPADLEPSPKQLRDGFLRVGRAFQGFFKGEYGQWPIAIRYVGGVAFRIAKVAVPKMAISNRFRVVPA